MDPVADRPHSRSASSGRLQPRCCSCPDPAHRSSGPRWAAVTTLSEPPTPTTSSRPEPARTRCGPPAVVMCAGRWSTLVTASCSVLELADDRTIGHGRADLGLEAGDHAGLVGLEGLLH